MLPLDVVARVWDAFFVLDEAFLMQIALGVLSFLRAQLLAAEFGPCLQMLRQVPSDVNPVELFDGISCVELSRSDYFEFVAQERAAAKAGGHPGSLKSPGKLNMFKSLFRAKR